MRSYFRDNRDIPRFQRSIIPERLQQSLSFNPAKTAKKLSTNFFTDEAMELRRVDKATTDISIFSSTDHSDLQERNIFKSFSNYLELFFPSLWKNKHRRSERGQLGEPDDTRARGLTVTIRKDEDGDHEEFDIFEGVDEQIWYQNETITVTYKLFIKALSFSQALFRSPGLVIYKPSKTYETVMAKLIRLEDNGDFDEFDSYSSYVVKHYENTDPDLVAAATVEQAVCFVYREDLKAAKVCAKRGYELARCTSFPSMFQARALISMATISRRKNKLGSAKKYLELAEQSFQSGWSYEDMAHFHEGYGTFLDSFMGNLPNPDQNVKELALVSFKKMSEVASQDARPRVNDKNKFYALILSARILLDSNSSFGRQGRAVSEASVALAGQYLGIIKKDLWKSIPRGSQIQFRLVESDLYFRLGKFEEERQLLEECLQEARTYGFKTEEPIIIQVSRRNSTHLHSVT